MTGFEKVAGFATRDIRLNGADIEKFDPVSLPEDQFRDLESIGFVERGDAPPKPPKPRVRPKAKPVSPDPEASADDSAAD